MMSNNNVISKIARDTFSIQLKWSVWFISIVFFIFVVAKFFMTDTEGLDENFLNISIPPSKIFMLVNGILVSFTFLEHYIGLRVSRKQFFYGIVMSSIGIAIALTMIVLLFQGLAYLIGDFTPLNLGQLGIFEDGSLSTVVKHIFNLFSYYGIGWIISSGFYRYGGWGGIGLVLVGIAFMAGIELIWEGNLSNTMFNWLNIQLSDFNLMLSMILSILLIFLNYWLIKRLLARVPTKIS